MDQPQTFSFVAGSTMRIHGTASVSLNTMTVRFELSRAAGGHPVGAPLLTTEGDGANASIQTDGVEFTIAASPAATQELRGTYIYGVEAEDVYGDKDQIAWGYVTFTPDLVRA